MIITNPHTIVTTWPLKPDYHWIPHLDTKIIQIANNEELHTRQERMFSTFLPETARDKAKFVLGFSFPFEWHDNSNPIFESTRRFIWFGGLKFMIRGGGLEQQCWVLLNPDIWLKGNIKKKKNITGHPAANKSYERHCMNKQNTDMMIVLTFWPSWHGKTDYRFSIYSRW